MPGPFWRWLRKTSPASNSVPEPVGAAAAAAIDLVKLAQVLPAVLVADTDPAISGAFDPRIITVDAKAVTRFREEGDAIACDSR